MDDVALVEFQIDHEIDPLADLGFHLSALEETVLSVEPFEAQFTFIADKEALILTVDECLSVVTSERETVGAETDDGPN